MPKYRSRRYPVMDLGDALDAIFKISNQLGEGFYSKDSIARVFNYRSDSSGPANRKLAALNHFGLVEKQKHGFALTKLAKEYCEARREGSDTIDIVRDAFRSVDVFTEVLEHYTAYGKIPEDLSDQLVKNFGIAENASEDVASLFLESGYQCQLLDKDGRLTQHLRDKPAQAEPRTFDLTDGKQCILPSAMSKRDIQILYKYLEALELLTDDPIQETLAFPRKAHSK